MAKRIGLVSYHKDPNYGTMYQAFALAKAISGLGGIPEYIRYKPIPYRSPLKSKIIEIVKWILDKSGIRRIPVTECSFLKTKDFRNLVKKYDAFHDKHIPVSEILYFSNTVSESTKYYDFFVVGSDQTWSPTLNANPRTPNFLSFVEDKYRKRAYAPSIGSVHVTKDYQLRLVRELSSFEYLSCREFANSDMLSKALGRKVQHVLDPTLLLQAEDWQSLEETVSMPEEYVLCYILGTKPCVSDYAERLGKDKGLPVYYMVTRPEYFQKQNKLVDISPEQFLWLMHHASYVVTDSFHGSVFCINFNRNFFSFAKRPTNDPTGLDNDRIMDFLTYVGLQNRFMNDGEMRIEDDIDFTSVNEFLSKAREESIQYLTAVISE